MRIVLKEIWATPEGVKQPGIHDVDDAQGRKLVAAGHASELNSRGMILGPDGKPIEIVEESEQATAPVGPETAANRRGKVIRTARDRVTPPVGPGAAECVPTASDRASAPIVDASAQNPVATTENAGGA